MFSNIVVLLHTYEKTFARYSISLGLVHDSHLAQKTSTDFHAAVSARGHGTQGSGCRE